MIDQQNTPELRFPDFKDEWKLQKLGNLAQFSKGKSLSKKDLNINGNPCILYGELYTKYGAILNKVYSKTSTQNDSLVFSKRNQILIPSSGETDIDIATATAIDTDVKIAIGGDLNIITPINSDGRFISLYINGKGKYNLAKYAQGKSVVHLYNADIKKLNFYLPTNMVEQKKIGNFFSKLDRQIELEEEKLELLEQQKKSYMQKIFSQELRFKDENGQCYTVSVWESKKLGELASITTGSLDANAMVPNGKYKFFTCARETYEINTYAFDTEALLISGNGANVGYIHYYQGKFNAYQRTYVLDKFNANIIYLKYYLEKYLLRRIYSEKRDGNTPYITRNTLYDMEIMIPSLEEQEKIGNFFDKVDNLIKRQSDKIELLKQRKKGLLQKMFV
ncbi:restriction endonuclease subunit S [Staphylococcus hominis]|uniref:restriction endonuclease subunit S n=1 Tax=Staphylococcus hominis TaxID=1290 RepID=UPI00066BE082|nr:restriction endonuclease subunit S [Staphylococcus hominis]